MGLKAYPTIINENSFAYHGVLGCREHKYSAYPSCLSLLALIFQLLIFMASPIGISRNI